MKNLMCFTLALSLLAVPLIASDCNEPCTQEVVKQEQENAQPIYKKIAQKLWENKGRIAVLSAVVLVAAALSYSSNEPFLGWKTLAPKSEVAVEVAPGQAIQSTPVEQPLQDKVTLATTQEEVQKTIELADQIVSTESRWEYAQRVSAHAWDKLCTSAKNFYASAEKWATSKQLPNE